jgi:site-specific recombinase XerD
MVQEALGHSSLSTTEVYTIVPRDYIKGIFDKKNNMPLIPGLI